MGIDDSATRTLRQESVAVQSRDEARWLNRDALEESCADPFFRPRNYGKGSRQCRVCAHQAGLIR